MAPDGVAPLVILGTGPVGPGGGGPVGVRYLHSHLIEGCIRGHLGLEARLLDVWESFMVQGACCTQSLGGLETQIVASFEARKNWFGW